MHFLIGNNTCHIESLFDKTVQLPLFAVTTELLLFQFALVLVKAFQLEFHLVLLDSTTLDALFQSPLSFCTSTSA